MSEQSPVGRLKAALIAALTDQVENGVKVIDKETREVEEISCPANVLAVAAKVVKDFHQEVGTTDASVTALDELVKRYQHRKVERAQAH